MKKLIMTLFAVMGVAGLLTVSPVKAQTVDNTPDCDTVAIIKCGSFSESELLADFDKNEYGDLTKVYSAFGITRSELNGFKSGVVWKDGRVTVDGQVVATGAVTAGRWFNPTSDMTRIPDTVRAYKMSTSHFVTDGQTAFVKMTDGKFDFAVLKTCGNPVNATAKVPKPETKVTCDSLTVTPITGSDTQFKFEAKKTVVNSAFKSFRFVVTDASGNVISTVDDTDGVLDYTQTKAGVYTVQAHVLTQDGKIVTSVEKCKKTFTVKAVTPIAECKSLKANPTGTAREFKFVLDYTAEGGAILRTVDFDFAVGEDLEKRPGLTPDMLSDVRYTYPDANKHTAEATLHFDLPGGVKKVEKCSAAIPEGQVLSEQTPPPAEEVAAIIPETGAAQIIGAGAGISTITAAGWYYVRSRKNFLSSFLNNLK